MQTRKSGNSKDLNNSSLPNSSNIQPTQWQSTTLGAISKQQRSGLSSATIKGMKAESKPPFVQSQIVSNLTVSQNVQSAAQQTLPTGQTLTSQQTRNQLVLGQGSNHPLMYQTEARSPVANKAKGTIMSSAIKRASEALSGNKMHHPHSAVKKSESNSSIRLQTSKLTSKNMEDGGGNMTTLSGENKLNIRSPRILEIQIKNELNPVSAMNNNQRQSQEMKTSKNEQKKRQESSQKVNGSSGPTQIQNHSGSGSQQNLFIKNLFFIHNGAQSGLDEDLRTSARHKLSSNQQISQQNQQDQEIAPSSSTQLHFNDHFSDHLSKNQMKGSEPSSHKNIRPPSLSPTKPQQHLSDYNFQENRNKAIDIATSVLQHLVPLASQSKDENQAQQQISGASVRMSVQTNKLSEPQYIEAQFKINNQGAQHIQNDKRQLVQAHAKQQSEEYQQVQSVEYNGSIKEESPKDEHHAKSNIQQLSMLSLQSKTKKPSYGEMPKYNKNERMGSTLIPKIDVLSPQKQAKDLNTSSNNKTQHNKKGSQSRNQGGEVFNYKMKTMMNAKQQQHNLYQPNLTTVNHGGHMTVQIENSSDVGSSYQDKNLIHRNNSLSQKHTISKSHSQQNFKVTKKSINLREAGGAGLTYSGVNPSEDGIRNDAIYMSLGNLGLKQRQQSQAQDSQYIVDNSQYKYESAYGDKQSEISSNMDRVDKQCIKVVARFRPYNTIEKEIQELYPNKTEIVLFNENDAKTVKLVEEFHTQSSNLNFTFDHIFRPHISQQEVFSIVGSSMIEDIMQGYNGTIFAYGQTGSGKTFTMYGDDIFDESKMGLVPRAARQIFDHIRDQDLEVEYSIRVQMLEIYKETLRDLLHNSNERPPELKIKECPKRGTYVEGLQDVCIVNEEEIMSVICTGETMRHVASTQLNQVSSRSHSICMIEVISKYPNDSERRGVLNLCDLAGSERVSRSMAQGPALEEAKKINFSLSMLGKVINSLTKNQAHIPYRDSKLTRLLKESLGGNNKTSLIVACSMHHSNFEETLSSLRFAQSAKFIQNKVKLNIKTSSIQLQIIIEQLKIELRSAKEEIQRLRIESSQCHSQINNKDYNQSMISSKLADNDSAYKPIVLNQIQPSLIQGNASVLGATPLQAIHNLPHQSLLAKNFDVIDTNNHQSVQLITTFQSNDASQPLQTQMSSNTYGMGSPSKLILVDQTMNQSPNKRMKGCGDPFHQQMIARMGQENEELEMRIKSKDQDILAIQFQKDELQLKVSSLEDKVTGYKHRLLGLERKLQEQESQRDFLAGKEVTQSHKMRYYENQIKCLNEQVSSLQRALDESEERVTQLSSEKLHIIKKKSSELLEETIKIMKIQMTKDVEGLVTSAANEYAVFGHNDHSKHVEDPSIVQEIHLNDKKIIKSNMYSSELNNQIIDGSIPSEVSIYLLKTQLIDVCLANHNLQRYISMTDWKLAQETSKLKSKEQQCANQEETIGTLESILDRTRINQDKLRSRVDKLENQMNLKALANNQGDAVIWNDAQSNGNGSIGGDTITNRATTMNMDTFTKVGNFHSQSLLSGSMQNATFGHGFMNSKTRFKRIINSKTLRRTSRGEKSSPSSRISMKGGTLANQSIMSQYYGLKQNAIQMMSGGIQITQKPQLSQIDSNTAGGSHSSNTQDHHLLQEKNDGDDFQRDDHLEDIYRDDNFLAKSARDPIGMQKLSGVTLTAEDLKKIDLSGTLQDVKDFLRAKQLSGSIGQRIRAFTMTSGGGASSARKSSSPKVGARQQIGKDLYQVSELSEIRAEEEKAAIGAIMPTQPNLILETSGIQEVYFPKADNFMMQTLNSDTLNSNSIVGHSNNLFTRSAFQPQALLDKLASLSEQLALVREDASMQRTRADELKKLCQEYKREIVTLKAELEEKDVKFAEKLREESAEWEKAIQQIKKLSEGELLRKQREIKKLNELLGKWIDGFQRNGGSGAKIKELITESVNVQKSEINNILLTEVMLSPTPISRPSNQLTFSNIKVGSNQKQFINNLTAKKSPKVEGKQYLKTPQSKGFSYQPIQTEYHNPSPAIKLGHNLTLSGGNVYAPLHSHASCASPSMNMIITDKQEHQIIKGDNSPVHEDQHHSSIEDEVHSPCSESSSSKKINMFNASPDKDIIGANNNCIRVVKSREQQLSLPSIGQNNLSQIQPKEQMSFKTHTFVAGIDSQDSSKIEWNVMNSHQDMSDVLSQGNNNNQVQKLAALMNIQSTNDNGLGGSVIVKQQNQL